MFVQYWPKLFAHFFSAVFFVHITCAWHFYLGSRYLLDCTVTYILDILNDMTKTTGTETDYRKGKVNSFNNINSKGKYHVPSTSQKAS